MSVATAYARNGDVKLAMEVLGQGDPVLLVHGLGYDRHGWGPLPDLLAQRFAVVLFDNRGAGESSNPPGPYTTLQLAEDAAAVLDAAGFERAHVVGTSLGGMTAQELVLGWPERVDRLVLACTLPGGTRSYPMPAAGIRVFTRMTTVPPEVALREAVETALARRTVSDRPDLVEEIYAYRLANKPSLDGWQAQAAASLGFDAFERGAHIHAPTLVLHGTDDNVVDPRNASLLAGNIPGARLELFQDAGHLFFWEEPERFAGLVTSFLEGHDDR